MNENNIETIDMTEMQKGRNSNNEKDNGGLNLSFFDDMENTFNTYRKFCQETRDMVKEAAKNAIAKAGLQIPASIKSTLSLTSLAKRTLSKIAL